MECEWGMRMSVRDLSISIAKLNGLNKEKKVEKRSETSGKVGGSKRAGGERREDRRVLLRRLAACSFIINVKYPSKAAAEV